MGVHVCYWKNKNLIGLPNVVYSLMKHGCACIAFKSFFFSQKANEEQNPLV